mmetsp:Transcript_38265/g.113411  ORF Transcript_38265/g.113411 Transcript_38265/m.113411 type:complete len:152 (-) Transcript_38265:322-777(-)
MAEALSESELEELREVFDMMDKDKGGSLNVEEVKQLLDMLGMKMRMDEVEAMVAEIDHDHSGEVEFDEFVKVMTSTHQLPHSKEDVMRAFKLMLPKDAPEGFIKKEDLEKALLHYAVPKVAEDEILRLLSEWHCDEHGVIDYRSKVNMLMH